MSDIGIYKQDFIDYLKFHLGEDSVTIKSKNIICRCPWCEMDKERDHYHLYISTELPMFHCFYAGCPKVSGSIKELTKKISGLSRYNKYVNVDRIKVKKNVIFKKKEITKKFIIPPLNVEKYREKNFYLKTRFSFSNIDLSFIKGLIFDIEEFIKINKIELDGKQLNLLPFLQSNFIGFLSEHQSILTLRNIDSSSHFRHYKLQLYEPILLDYYKINGNPKGTKIVLAEGIFDIFGEYLFDHLNIKNEVLLYACGYSTSYKALLKSIAFHENIYKPDVIILSDQDVNKYFYKSIKQKNKHLMDTFKIFYNSVGKDFGEHKCNPIQVAL